MTPRPRPGTSDEIRRAFIQFFAERGHVHQPSSSLVPYNDPSVLLTTAGMQQMIPYMLGREEPPAVRMTSIQKCFRTGDIDEVGNPRNLTFFEMMGNFSIGDYFKESIVPWSWEFISEWLQLPADKVHVTIHPSDDEARRIWIANGYPAEKITELADNWWGPPGAEGPCGPDSELYYDWGPELGCGEPTCAPGCDCDRFLEFWNLVFMQFYQDRDGNRTPLAKANVDTGAGLERITAIMQQVQTVYETDLFRPIIDVVAARAGIKFGQDEALDYALRVVADHVRGATFLAADGVLPGNEGRNYVMRRIVRRAVRYGRKLGIREPFLAEVADVVITRMAAHHSELFLRGPGIKVVIGYEETRFAETLASGTERLNDWIALAKERGESQVEGRLLFMLHDSFGFPYELSEEMVAEAGLTADRAGFDASMEEQRARSRATAAFRGVADDKTYEVGDVPATSFVGFERLEAQGTVLALRDGERAVAELKHGQAGLIVLDQTAFYAEGGGQVGDHGIIRGADGTFRVTDTRRIDDRHIAHFGVVESGIVRGGGEIQGEVDRGHRAASARHHTITHILHRTLKDVLGEATEQKGSLVAPHVARFDFNYPRGLSREQLAQIHATINRHVYENLPVGWQVMDIDAARKAGAVAIFGEKYGHQVRVVDIGGWSKELCGGTHVHRSGDIGTAVLVRESGLASGIRRVEVLAGEPAFNHAWEQQERLLHLARMVGAPLDQIEAKLSSLQEELDQARRDAARLEQQLASGRATELVDTAVQVSDIKVLAAQVEASSRDALRDLADQLRAKLGTSVVALGASFEGQQAFVVGASREAIEHGVNAGDILRQALAAAGGKGGGRPDFAQGGVKEAGQLTVALAQVVPLVERAVGGA